MPRNTVSFIQASKMTSYEYKEAQVDVDMSELDLGACRCYPADPTGVCEQPISFRPSAFFLLQSFISPSSLPALQEVCEFQCSIISPREGLPANIPSACLPQPCLRDRRDGSIFKLRTRHYRSLRHVFSSSKKASAYGRPGCREIRQ